MAILFADVTAVTMDPAQRVIPHAYVVVEGKNIVSVGTQRPQGTFDRVISGEGRVLMPGLINAHTHVPMTLMRGYGGVYFGAPEDFSPETCNDCRNQQELTEQWHGAGEGQILVDASIHAEYTSNPPLWQWMADYAAAHDLGMQVHISETRLEHESCLEKYGKTPVALLDQYGVWERGGTAAHCVWVTDEDMALMAQKHITPEDWALLAEKGVSAVHNPMSNLKLGSGVARVPQLLKAGVNVALGTDGVSSNNNCDLFEEIKLAGILHKGVSHDPMAVTAWEALSMATVNGAKALGRNTGVIAPGKTADLILVDFTAPNLFPCHDPVENLVFSARGNNVVMNMARGQVIYENGEFMTLDLDKIRYQVTHYALPLVFPG